MPTDREGSSAFVEELHRNRNERELPVPTNQEDAQGLTKERQPGEGVPTDGEGSRALNPSEGIPATDQETAPAFVEDTPITLTVCVEGPFPGASVDSVKETAKELSDYYRKIRRGKVDFAFEVLGSDSKERGTQIRRLQMEQMAGGGPDVYIFQNQGLYEVYEDDELLFADLNQAMGTGVFADLNPLIRDDAGFSLDRYHPVIMEAGTVSDKRFLLPLSFSYYTAWMADPDSGSAQEDRDLQRIASPELRLLLDQPVDFSKKDLEDAVAQYSNFGEHAAAVFSMGGDEGAGVQAVPPMLERNSLEMIAEAKGAGVSLKEYPLLNGAGGITASINSGVALGANGKHLSEAYGYIKLFLDPALQMGESLKINNGEVDVHYGSSYISAFPQWPVWKDADPQAVYASLVHRSTLPLDDCSLRTDQITSAYFRSVLDEKIHTVLSEMIYGPPAREGTDWVDALYQDLQAGD